MKHPNLYIIGAPKSGTTSLYQYLNQHPNISIPLKEPRYLIKQSIQNVSDDDPIKPYLLRSSILDKESYNKLYNNKTEKILCDASSQYLYHHREVITQIKALEDSQPTKIIILLRNPIERAFSNYLHNCATFEYLDFFQALEQEHSRILKGFNSFWHYKGLSTYYDSVKAYLEAFDEVKIILFEDFVNNIDLTLVDIFNFLQVDSSFKVSHFMINKKSTGLPKSKTLNSILQSSSNFKLTKAILHKTIGQKRTKLIKEFIMRKNLSKSKISLQESLKSNLESYFVEDIEKLKIIMPKHKIDWLNNGKTSQNIS
ncbi:sulfotransferase [Flavobacteriales bacterium]|nr:sulfotransferase [Flavobacteriales bacterium]